jgi:DNA-binding beta-propeller fold protein YncE
LLPACVGLTLAFVSTTSAEEPPVLVLQWGSSGSGAGQFNDPWHIAVDDSGFVYVADNRNARIQKFTDDGTYVTAFGSFATGAYEPVFAVAVDNNDQVFAGENNNHTVQVFTSDGVFVREWAIPDTQIPTGLAVDSEDNVYVSSEINPKIFKYTNAGSLITSWETFGLTPDGIAVNDSDDLYVAVWTGILKFTSDGMFIAQYGTPGSGDGQFQDAYGVAVDAAGNIFATDWTNNRVQKLRPDGLYLSQWEVPLSVGIAIGPRGEIYVGHRHEILRYEYPVSVNRENWGKVKSRYRTPR